MKTMKKMMTLLAVVGMVLALAPAAQAADVTWVGGGADPDAWDTTSGNWGSGGATTYTDGDSVIFDGTGTPDIIDLTGNRTPEAVADGVTVSGAIDQELTGSGIIGGTGLIKSGIGTLTLSNTGNAYTMQVSPWKQSAFFAVLSSTP